MCLKQHPNFQAVNFATLVIDAFYDSLRGSAEKYRIDSDKLKDLIHKFSNELEDIANDSAKSVVNFEPCPKTERNDK